MSLTARIVSHLPSLRRYARALTGSQAAGDAHVTATLEALIADIGIFPSASTDRVAVYKLFASLYEPLAGQLREDSSTVEWETWVAANLAAVPTRARQAFLLSAVESFTPEEIAEILEVSEAGVHRLLDEAAKEIELQVATDVMIVEDDPLIAMDMQDLVKDLHHRVVGVARTRGEAIDLYRRHRPGLILADVKLADGSSGIDTVNEILTHRDIPVVYVTAYPEELLTGEANEPTFIVRKPFNPNAVKALICQAVFFTRPAEQAA